VGQDDDIGRPLLLQSHRRRRASALHWEKLNQFAGALRRRLSPVTRMC
jgi:hypothetical protein